MRLSEEFFDRLVAQNDLELAIEEMEERAGLVPVSKQAAMRDDDVMSFRSHNTRGLSRDEKERLRLGPKVLLSAFSFFCSFLFLSVSLLILL